MANLTNLTITKARALLDSKEVSVRELVDYYRGVIAAKNPEINAYLEVFDDIDEEIDRAQDMINAGQQKELTGIPYALKDNILYQGHRASSASKILEGYIAPYDSFVVARLRDQGAIALGRVNMDEFAMGSSTENSAFGTTKNPLDLTRVPGGSSGGPVAAVAMDSCVFALASDTGGSIRQPASLCGLVGLCPTYGAVSRSGLMALASSLDCIGPLAKNVEDAEIVHRIIAGHDPIDATSVPETHRAIEKKSVKNIGVPRAFVNAEGVSADVIARFNETLEKLAAQGYEIIDIDLPHAALALPVYYVILPAEVSANLGRYDGVRYGLQEKGEDLLATYMKTRGEGFGKEVRRRAILGTYVLSAGYRDAYYGQATKLRALIRQEFIDAFTTVDLIATPATVGEAFPFGAKSDPVAMYMSDFFAVPGNIASLPGISVPMGTGSAGMPLGCQFLAPHFHEHLLFEIGKNLGA